MIFHYLSLLSFSFLLSIFNCTGPANGESNYETEPVEFDPINKHNPFCPWVNGNVAAAGSSCNGSSSGASSVALCGWQLTLDALDAFQSLGHVPVQTMESESAASMYKVWSIIQMLFTFCFRTSFRQLNLVVEVT